MKIDSQNATGRPGPKPRPEGRSGWRLALGVLACCLTLSFAGDKPSPREDGLTVGLLLLDPGLDEDPTVLERRRIFPNVRRAEARIFPVQLARGLGAAGPWRSIQLIPEEVVVDLTVGGKIRRSDARRLVIEIRAVDATGSVWLERRYRAMADAAAYDLDSLPVDGWVAIDPFEELYERIAADLRAAAGRRTSDELRQIRWTARMRRAAQLAPPAFEDFLGAGPEGRFTLSRLPAEDEPMLARIKAIEDRERLFLHTLTRHQIDFVARISEPYTHWRRLGHENWVLLERSRSARTDVEPPVYHDPFDRSLGYGTAPSRRHIFRPLTRTRAGVSPELQEYLRVDGEIGAMLDAEVSPLLVELEGQTLRLEGTAATMYQTWSALLRQLHREEVGLEEPVEELERP